MKTGLLRTLTVVAIALAVPAALRADLVVYYDFDSAANPAIAVDSSGKGNAGDVVNATYGADGSGHTGQPGDRAIDFGVYNNDAYVTIPSAASGALSSLTTNNAATISLWIKGGPEQPAPQWTFYAGPGRQLGSHSPWSDGTIYFDAAGCCGATQRISKNEPNAANYKDGWNHYAFVKDGSSTAIYQNGALFHDSAAATIDPLGAITEFVLGAGPVDDRRSYAGQMDDLAIFDVALSSERIADIAAGGVVPEPSSLALSCLAVLGLLGFRRR
jgi:hypothetical protein